MIEGGEKKPMNNIEILEEYLDKQDRKFVSEHRLMILQAIENLIQENKELKKYRTYYDNAKVVWSRNDYISKDKIKEYYKQVKEKIKKVEEDKNYGRYKKYGGKIKLNKFLSRLYGINEICETLLEERN